MAEPTGKHVGGLDPLPTGALQAGYYVGPEGSSCPPEYANVPTRVLIAQIDAERRGHADEREILAAGFRSRASSSSPQAGSGFESGGALDLSAPSGPLAGLTDAVTRDGRLAGLTDDELIGVLRA